VTLTLSDPLAGALNTGTVGGATSTFAGGVWTVTGPIADVNALLAALAFTPAANYNGNFTIATSVSDGVAPALTGTKAVTGTPVNDAPVLVNNSFSITNGGTLDLTSVNLSATDSDDLPDTLVFTVTGVANGQFLVNGVPATSFTQLQLTSGFVQFVHDGSGVAPTFMLEVADPATAVDGPYLGNIAFTAGGGSGGAGAGGGAGVGGSANGAGILLNRSVELPIVPLAFAPDVLPTPLLPLVDPAAQQFLRRPAVVSEGRDDGGTPPAATAAPADTPDRPARQPAVSKDVAPKTRDATPAETRTGPHPGPEATLEPARTEAGAIPARDPAIGDEAPRRVAPNAAELRITAIVASVGSAPAIARAAGRIAQLLARPSWRNIDSTPPAERKRAKSRRAAATRTRRRFVKRAKAPRKSKD
jgi:hypothetical protein